MKAFAIFVVLIVAAAAQEKPVETGTCYKKIDAECSNPSIKINPNQDPLICNAVYGHIDIVTKHLIDFANSHIYRSFEYLLMSSYYGNYQRNRPGFEKLFRELSDSKWESAIDIIKHITTRGGEMKFDAPETFKAVEGFNGTTELFEIESVAKALDIEKKLAVDAFDVHKEASKRADGKHDAEISSYIEKEFVHEHSKNIRKLAGYVTDLKSMLSGSDGTLALFLFDEYLQKQ